MGLTQTSRGAVNVVVSGNGPPVVLIHSVGADLSLWDDVARELRNTSLVIAYDVRGHGGSALQYGGMSIESWSDDLSALLEALEIEGAIVVGLSMGGMIAQHFAAHHPTNVLGLVLMDTASDYQPEARQVWEQRAVLAEKHGMAPLVEPTIARWFTPPFIERKSSSLQRVRKAVAAMDPQNYAAGCRALGNLNTTPDLHLITCPTLVVVGEHDEATPKHQSERIVEHISGATLLVVPDAAHCPPVEQAEAVIELLESFLAKVAQ